MQKKTKEFNEKAGAKIKHYRTELGISQDDLANHLQLTRVQIVNIESGTSGTTPETIYRICCALNCGIADLFPPIEKVKHKTEWVTKKVVERRVKNIRVKKIKL